jgi:hypothetical protein
MLCPLGLFQGTKIFLTFSLLDVPLISRGLWPGFLWELWDLSKD